MLRLIYFLGTLAHILTAIRVVLAPEESYSYPMDTEWVNTPLRENITNNLVQIPSHPAIFHIETYIEEVNKSTDVFPLISDVKHSFFKNVKATDDFIYVLLLKSIKLQGVDKVDTIVHFTVERIKNLKKMEVYQNISADNKLMIEYSHKGEVSAAFYDLNLNIVFYVVDIRKDNHLELHSSLNGDLVIFEYSEKLKKEIRASEASSKQNKTELESLTINIVHLPTDMNGAIVLLFYVVNYNTIYQATFSGVKFVGQSHYDLNWAFESEPADKIFQIEVHYNSYLIIMVTKDINEIRPETYFTTLEDIKTRVKPVSAGKGFVFLTEFSVRTSLAVLYTYEINKVDLKDSESYNILINKKILDLKHRRVRTIFENRKLVDLENNQMIFKGVGNYYAVKSGEEIYIYVSEGSGNKSNSFVFVANRKSHNVAITYVFENSYFEGSTHKDSIAYLLMNQKDSNGKENWNIVLSRMRKPMIIIKKPEDLEIKKEMKFDIKFSNEIDRSPDITCIFIPLDTFTYEYARGGDINIYEDIFEKHTLDYMAFGSFLTQDTSEINDRLYAPTKEGIEDRYFRRVDYASLARDGIGFQSKLKKLMDFSLHSVTALQLQGIQFAELIEPIMIRTDKPGSEHWGYLMYFSKISTHLEYISIGLDHKFAKRNSFSLSTLIKRIGRGYNYYYLLNDAKQLYGVNLENTRQISEFHFPGKPCLDIEILAHQQLSELLACYHSGLSIDLYITRELEARSRFGGLLPAHTFLPNETLAEKISRYNGELLYSEEYRNLLFLHFKQPELIHNDIVLIRIEWLDGVRIDMTTVLSGFLKFGMVIDTTLINKYFVSVVKRNGLIYIYVAEFDQNEEVFNIIDSMELPQTYYIKNNAKLTKVDEFLRVNQEVVLTTIPYVLVEIQSMKAHTPGGYNVLLIDPAISRLARMASLLLPLDSKKPIKILQQIWIDKDIKKSSVSIAFEDDEVGPGKNNPLLILSFQSSSPGISRERFSIARLEHITARTYNPDDLIGYKKNITFINRLSDDLHDNPEIKISINISFSFSHRVHSKKITIKCPKVIKIDFVDLNFTLSTREKKTILNLEANKFASGNIYEIDMNTESPHDKLWDKIGLNRMFSIESIKNFETKDIVSLFISCHSRVASTCKYYFTGSQEFLSLMSKSAFTTNKTNIIVSDSEFDVKLNVSAKASECSPAHIYDNKVIYLEFIQGRLYYTLTDLDNYEVISKQYNIGSSNEEIILENLMNSNLHRERNFFILGLRKGELIDRHYIFHLGERDDNELTICESFKIDQKNMDEYSDMRFYKRDGKLYFLLRVNENGIEVAQLNYDYAAECIKKERNTIQESHRYDFSIKINNIISGFEEEEWTNRRASIHTMEELIDSVFAVIFFNHNYDQEILFLLRSYKPEISMGYFTLSNPFKGLFGQKLLHPRCFKFLCIAASVFSKNSYIRFYNVEKSFYEEAVNLRKDKNIDKDEPLVNLRDIYCFSVANITGKIINLEIDEPSSLYSFSEGHYYIIARTFDKIYYIKASTHLEIHVEDSMFSSETAVINLYGLYNDKQMIQLDLTGKHKINKQTLFIGTIKNTLLIIIVLGLFLAIEMNLMRVKSKEESQELQVETKIEF